VPLAVYSHWLSFKSNYSLLSVLQIKSPYWISKINLQTSIQSHYSHQWGLIQTFIGLAGTAWFSYYNSQQLYGGCTLAVVAYSQIWYSVANLMVMITMIHWSYVLLNSLQITINFLSTVPLQSLVGPHTDFYMKINYSLI
jgi:hypothetical protein